jgi:hypothetical protein
MYVTWLWSWDRNGAAFERRITSWFGDINVHVAATYRHQQICCASRARNICVGVAQRKRFAWRAAYLLRTRGCCAHNGKKSA